MNNNPANSAHFSVKLGDVALPNLSSAKTHRRRITVNDYPAKLPFPLEREDFFGWRRAAGSVVEFAEGFVVGFCSLLYGHLAGETAGLGFSVGMVLDGDFFAVTFVDMHVWGEIAEQVAVGGCGDDCFAVFAGDFLQVERQDFCCAAVKGAGELV
ncbi:MAG: hypothetical protein NWE98_08725 [Candidatus Bathyarchaeota archaeon]|nr:hypothetical protein [Candidatus Bathyarchaeota archaeon]